ncbi:MAG: hypothetical protein PHY34_01960 [Patescibacteria group bacterium]|nr:hypothetical protein [Patescibacteria group bacterium]MDD5715300.1 hypothetical protein [Patescibacteria group bacterium]
MRVDKKLEDLKKPEQKKEPQPIGKVIVLLCLVVGSTALFWLVWHNALVTGITLSTASRNVMVAVTTLLAFSLMFCLLAAAELLIRGKLMLLAMALAAPATVFVFFRFSVWSFIGYLIMALAFLYWRREIRIDGSSRVKFMPTRTVNVGLKTAVTLVLLAASFTYYSYLVTGNDASDRLEKSLIDDGTVAAENILRMYFKDKYNPHMELDTFIETVGIGEIENVLPNDTGSDEIDRVLDETAESAKLESITRVREELLKSLKIEAAGDEEVRDVVRKIVEKNLSTYIDPYLKFFPAIMAVGLFFLLNIFSFLYRELIKSFSFFMFCILKWTKFIRVEKEQIEVERIKL